VSDLALAVSRDKSLLTHDAEAVVSRHLEYLLSLGIPKVGPMIQSVPQLLSCDLTHDLHRKVTILQALGVRKIGHWLYKNRGRVVTMDIETEMRPPVDFLRSVPNLKIERVLETLPAGVFGKTRRAQMEARVRYLSEDLGVGAHRVGKMISRWPYVLTMSRTGTIQPKVEWLKSVGVDNLGHMLTMHPHVLSASAASLQAKHDFLVNVWGRPIQQIQTFPQALTYSLHYLRARAGYLKLKGKESDVGLHRALRTADHSFAVSIAKGSVEEYQALARAVKRGGSEEGYSAHDVRARAPGGGGSAFD